MSTTQTWRQCTFCQGLFIEPEIVYMADPYRQELYGEKAPVWICTKCQKERRVELKLAMKVKKADPPKPQPTIAPAASKVNMEQLEKEKQAKLDVIVEQLDRIENELKQMRKAIKDLK